MTPGSDGRHPPLPPALPSFEHVRRTWNESLGVYSARILPGEYYVTKSEEAVATTLGSCIAACIRDSVSGVGGMNHFMLPATDGNTSESWKAAGLGASTRYGNFAMEHLINSILRTGGRRENLEAKIFGGGRIIAKMTDVGARNIQFVRDYLRAERVRVVAEDVGDIHPRMVVYFPATGDAKVKRLRSLHNNLIAIKESSYINKVIDKPVSGDIELF
ncbi:MAG: chemoreceptor glutamine deamidase CheD [Burkholderiales bacterium]|nr:chemoreceptor glutamine deamidase CheD [Burkholderiales bacterium]